MSQTPTATGTDPPSADAPACTADAAVNFDLDPSIMSQKSTFSSAYFQPLLSIIAISETIFFALHFLWEAFLIDCFSLLTFISGSNKTYKKTYIQNTLFVI